MKRLLFLGLLCAGESSWAAQVWVQGAGGYSWLTQGQNDWKSVGLAGGVEQKGWASVLTVDAVERRDRGDVAGSLSVRRDFSRAWSLELQAGKGWRGDVLSSWKLGVDVERRLGHGMAIGAGWLRTVWNSDASQKLRLAPEYYAGALRLAPEVAAVYLEGADWSVLGKMQIDWFWSDQGRISLGGGYGVEQETVATGKIGEEDVTHVFARVLVPVGSSLRLESGLGWTRQGRLYDAFELQMGVRCAFGSSP